MSKYIVMNFRDYKDGRETNHLCLINTNGATYPEFFDWDDEIVISDPMNWYEGEIVTDDQFVCEGEGIYRAVHRIK